MNKKLPYDDEESDVTRLLPAGDADAGSPPPRNQAPSGADSLSPVGQQETLVHGPETTKIEARGAAKSESQSDINLSELNTDIASQQTGEFSVGVHNPQLTGTVDGIDATGEFSVTGATVNKPATQRGTGVNTVRSGRSDNTDSPIPEAVGKYQIKKVLGRGGMGVVYLARQVGLNRDVALKMVLVGAHASKSQLARFEAEARAVAQLQHPNIVQVFEVDKHDGLPFFSLEFVEGMSLDQRLGGKPLPPREAAQIMEKVCRAMQYAHDRGILHRDLKPANILMTKDGQPKVTDFGLAKQLEDDEADSLSTRAGTIMGTPSYMSPEQAQGLVDQLSPASDQYSLGAMLYELLTGRPPFLGTKAFDTISQVVHKEPVPPCQLQETMPVDIDTICLKALQKSPEKRYVDCQQMAEDLGRFLRGEPILARPISRLERGWRWCKRNPKIAIPSGLAAAMVIATAMISTWAWNETSAQAAIITEERDTANEQRGIAQENERKAKAAEAVAQKEKEEADRQRLLANEAKLQAEKNEELAKNQAVLALKNIQFIVTDIDDRLASQPGMSELRVEMLKVLEKKWDELDLQLTGGIRGSAIPTLMTVRFKIVDAWINLGKLAEADASLAKIYEQGKQRIVDKGRLDATRSNLAQICLKWGQVRQRMSADPQQNEPLLNEALDLLRDIIAHPLSDPNPETPGPSKYEIASTLQGTLLQMASARKKRGALDAAADNFAEGVTVSEDVLADIERKADWVDKVPEARLPVIKSYFQQNLDLCRTGRANILCSIGKVDEAIPIYQAVIQSRRAAVEADPKNRNGRDQLALQLRNFGQYMLRCGKADEGATALAESSQIAERLYNEDPKNAVAKRAAGYALYYLGTARDLQGHSDEALALFERARVLRTELKALSEDNSSKVDLMLAEARLGNFESARGLIDELSKTEAKNPDLRLDIARALAQLARVAEGGARDELLTQAFVALDRCLADGLIDPFPIASEPDLIPLRDDDRFKTVLAKLQK